ncbi:manganese efflux pump MntP [Pelotomaculum schinkii]|uniref:Manganese efflux pump MntP n=1 Tax=Pelotomaculum schinkii TaxID=78350 RepID=A0A4Y7RGK1_9FIRM|nr:sporulation membrane protein YtaF [Pelotomaculum schinkii]TEB08138.1 manganese efflux pump MntP [Pelotomaculum schinkii]
MHILSIVLLALSTSLDSLAVGIVYGLRKIRLPWSSNFLIAFLTGLGTFGAMKAGACIFTLIPPVWASYISSGVMAGAGVWIILQSRGKQGDGSLASSGEGSERTVPLLPGESECVPLVTFEIKALGLLIRILKEPVAVDKDCSGAIDFREACVLGLALTLNNLAGGLGGGMIGLNPGLTALLALVTSLLFFVTGLKLGQTCLSRWIGERSAVIAGLALIAIGVYELLA